MTPVLIDVVRHVTFFLIGCAIGAAVQTVVDYWPRIVDALKGRGQ